MALRVGSGLLIFQDRICGHKTRGKIHDGQGRERGAGNAQAAQSLAASEAAATGVTSNVASNPLDKFVNPGGTTTSTANVISPDKSFLNKLSSKEFYQGIGDKVTSADTYKAIGDRVTSPEMYKEMATNFIKRKPDGTINLLGTAGKFGKAFNLDGVANDMRKFAEETQRAEDELAKLEAQS